ncbi:MAG: hypothetical protein JEZ14_08955 [Marinilabiliaceae bacterium]|nr:hypothetical protein [Marinilabiliaceae bacterium]
MEKFSNSLKRLKIVTELLREDTKKPISDVVERSIATDARALRQISLDNVVNDKWNQPEWSERVKEAIRVISEGTEQEIRDFFQSRINRKFIVYNLNTSFDRKEPLINNPVSFSKALNMIDKNWSFSYYSGLLNTLLQEWGNPFIKDALVDFLKYEIKKEKSNSNLRQRTLDLINESQYFLNKDGISRLVHDISLLPNKMTDINLIILRGDGFQTTPYFTDFIWLYLDYFFKDDKGEVAINGAISYYTQMQNKVQKALFVARWCQAVLEGKYVTTKDRLKSFAFEKIGPTNKELYWCFKELNEEQLKAVETARRKIDFWIKERYVKLFFEVIDDPRRKAFWIKAIEAMDNLVLFVDQYHRWQLEQLLEGNDRQLQTYVRDLKGGCAMSFTIKEKLFVEFGGQGGGPLNVHDIPSVQYDQFQKVLKNRKLLNRADIYYTENELQTLVTTYGGPVNKSGYLAHRGYWEHPLRKWFRLVMRVDFWSE